MNFKRLRIYESHIFELRIKTWMNECDMNFIVQSLACMISIHNILTSYADDFCFQNNQKIPLWWLKTMIRMQLFHNSFICDHLTRTKLQISRRRFWNYFVFCLFVWSGIHITLCYGLRLVCCRRGWSFSLIRSPRSVCYHNSFGLCL